MYHPDTAFLILTTDCNRRDACPHCFYSMEPYRCVPGQLDILQWVDILHKLRLAGVRRVILTGGEPTLRGDILLLTRAAYDLSIDTLLLTNGALVDDALAAKLEESRLRAVSMTLARLDAAECAAAIRLAARRNMPLSFIFCFNKTNYELIPQAHTFASDLGASILFQPAFIPSGHVAEEQLSPRAVGSFEWSRIFTLLRPWAKENGLDKYLKWLYDFYRGDTAVRPAQCALSGHALVIDADGSVYPCFHRRDLACGSALGDEFSHALAALKSVYPQTRSAPCFGEHCISLHIESMNE